MTTNGCYLKNSFQLVAFVLAVLCVTNILDIIINQKSEIMYAASLTSSSLKALTFVSIFRYYIFLCSLFLYLFLYNALNIYIFLQLFCIILMLFNRKRGRHTSGILFLFWLVLTICETIQYRSAFIQIQTEVCKHIKLHLYKKYFLKCVLYRWGAISVMTKLICI